MGLFSSRGSRGLVPGDILQQLAAFGHACFDAQAQGQAPSDPRFDWPNFFSRMIPAYQTDLGRAIAEVRAAAEGDPYAMYGGYRLIAEFEPASQNPLYLEMMDAGLALMHGRGFSSAHLNGYERSRWISTHGDLRTSLNRSPERP